MPHPTTTLALFVLVALVELSPWVRVPTGLLLAIGVLVDGARVFPLVLLGACGIAAARLAIAYRARHNRRSSSDSPGMAAQRDLLRERLSDSRAYARVTFALAALPGVPATLLFPLIGAMRTPLAPALMGTIVGRIPWLAVTTALFVALGRLGSADDIAGAQSLGFIALVLIVVRGIGLVDWAHRAQTGAWRMRDARSGAARVTGMFTGASPHDAQPTETPFDDLRYRHSSPSRDDSTFDDDDVIDGEVLGEEIVDDGPGAGSRHS
ncbi:MAG: hypothetical protein JWN41_1003 [Thermoleophilia bacterium]|nr:hypothetical protein [Thermoleophilia bacterium]